MIGEVIVFRSTFEIAVHRAVLALLISATLACNSGRPDKAKTADNSIPSGSSQPHEAVAKPTMDIDLNCVIRHIQNPPDSFHYSLRDQSSNPWQEDADVTPQSITGSFMNNSLTAPQHFEGPPRGVSVNLMAIGRLADHFATVHGTSAVVKEGTENKNGYDAVKYSIDTGLGNATEQGLFKSVLGAGGFEKGTVWVTSEGCPVQIVLDEELHAKDGSPLSKAHYEESMVKQK